MILAPFATSLFTSKIMPHPPPKAPFPMHQETSSMPVKTLRGVGVIGDETGTGVERDVDGNIEPEMRQRFDMRV